MQKSLNDHSRAALLLTLIASAIGCGSEGGPSGSISGKVTFESKPVTEGTVFFVSKATGKSVSAALNDQGEFQVSRLEDLGPHGISILPPSDEVPPGGSEPPPPPKEHPNIPQKYRSETTSGLVEELKEGENVVAWDLMP